MKAVFLEPKSSFRNDLRSDTMWGLIISSLSLLHDESYIDKIIEQYLNYQLPFKISSCFPYRLNNGKRLIYLPKPILPGGMNSDADSDNQKRFKRIKYIELEYFNRIISGAELENFRFDDKDKYLENSFSTELFVKIQLNRLSMTTQNKEGEGQIFNTPENFISNGGLYFLIDGDVGIIEPALRLMSHIGFGGYTSKGKGNFQYFIDDIDIIIPDNPNAKLNLSLYHPLREELHSFIKNDNFFYEILTRKGKVANQHRTDKVIEKLPVNYFAEGSVFPDLNKPNYGTLINSFKNDSKKVFNYGFSFNIPINVV